MAKHRIYTLVDFHQDAFSIKDGYGAGEPIWATLGQGTTYNPGFPLNYYGGIHYSHKVIGTRLDDNFGAFWKDTRIPSKNEGEQEAYLDMLQHTVAYFGTMSSIVGYDIMNEPFIGDHWQQCKKTAANPEGGCPIFESQQLNQFMTSASRAIHSINPQAITWFEPNVEFGLGQRTYIGKLNDTNTGFDFHDYDDALKQPIDNALAEKQIANVPLFMTEFGAAQLKPQQLTQITADADLDEVSWTEWAYTNNPIFKFAHLPNKPAADPRLQGIVFDANKALTGTNVNWNRLNALTRPYPEFIAGTHSHFRYYNGLLDKRLVVSYAIDNQVTGYTQIIIPETPSFTIRNVTAQGAALISHKERGVLTFKNNTNTSQVTITVYFRNASHALS